MSLWLLGLDAGSTACKVVVVHAENGSVVWRDYQRHEARPVLKAAEMLARAERDLASPPEAFHAFVTGSAGAAIAERLGARYVQEVAALALAVERRHPRARTIIELGGQDAKIIQFEEAAGVRRTLASMNDKCAGGTGAVIDKIAAKLKIAPGQVGALRYRGLAVHPVAGKCGIFAETDINGLQKRGVPAAELMASLFEAIVLQNLSVLARGGTLEPQVVLLGGPNAFVAGLQEAWRTHLEHLWQQRSLTVNADDAEPAILVPKAAELYGALGAIDIGREDDEAPGRYLGAAALAGESAGTQPTRTRGVAALAASGLDLRTFLARYTPSPFTPPVFTAGEIVRGFIGLDAGSTSTKAVLLSEDGQVLAKTYQLSRGNPIEDGMDMFRALRGAVESQQARLEVQGLVTTGYAKDILRDVFLADAALVETVAHARSALHCCDDPHVIVDVGGQDIKIIVLRDGRVQDFRLNTQCSAGNGYFLQAIAASFGQPVERFAELAFSAREMPLFGYGCVLFLQTEIANVQRQGWRPEEILAGLAAVLPRNVFLYVANAPNLARLGTRFVLQGGTQRNLAAVKAQVDFIRANFHGQNRAPEIVVHEHCGEAGAIGAALEAVRLSREGHATTFIGLDAAERISHEARSGEETRCRFCQNACLRTFIEIRSAPEPAASRRLIVATCEKGGAEDVSQMRDIRAAIEAVKARTPNLLAVAAREAWVSRRPPLVAGPPPAHAWSPASRARAERARRRDRLRIGIPRVFNMYALAPLFSAYLESLGIPSSHIVYSGVTSPELYRAAAGRGAIDPCFPSKVAIAHVEQLITVKHRRTPLDVVFFPMIDDLMTPLQGTLGSSTCPTVALTPQTVRAAYQRDDAFGRKGIRYLDPLLNLADRRLFTRQMFAVWSELLGLGREEHERAIETGLAALASFDAAVRRQAREALDALERDGRVGVVLLGRVYHHDPGLNHGIPEELQKLGYPVFSQSTLPLDADLLDRLFGEEVRAGLIRHPLDISDVWKNAFSASSNLKIFAAKFAARHPNLVAVELSNFKCGHDAPIYSVVQEVVESSGTPYFAFKDIDENRPAGAIRLRVETIHYALQRYEQALARQRRRVARVERWLAGYERRLSMATAPSEDVPADRLRNPEVADAG